MTPVEQLREVDKLVNRVITDVMATDPTLPAERAAWLVARAAFLVIDGRRVRPQAAEAAYRLADELAAPK